MIERAAYFLENVSDCILIIVSFDSKCSYDFPKIFVSSYSMINVLNS